MAYMGRPFAPYLSLDVFLSHSIDFRKRDGLSWRRSHCLGFSKSRLGMRRASCMQWRFGSCTRRAVVVGHTQAMSRLTRHSSVGQGVSHWSGRVPSYPICIKWERERVFRSIVLTFLISAPSPTAAPSSLSRRREKVFAQFLHLFPICRLLSFSFLLRASLRATTVPRKEKGESEGEEKTHKSFHKPRVR